MERPFSSDQVVNYLVHVIYLFAVVVMRCGRRIASKWGEGRSHANLRPQSHVPICVCTRVCAYLEKVAR
jgi:hypothetical protein